MTKRKKVGVALGGGGSMGLAHIGVLKVLEREGIPIDFLSGTSMGALIAGAYSAENNLKKIEDIFTNNKQMKKIFDYTFPKHGLIKGHKIEKIIESELKGIKFNQLKIPLYVTAFDLKEKQEIIFNKGYVGKAIRASISIPGIFIPVENKGKILVDGGVIDPIPADILKKAGADIIIAVNVINRKIKKPILDKAVASKKKHKKTPAIWKTASDSFKVMSYEMYKHNLDKKEIDFVINVDTKNKNMLNFSKKDVLKEIKEGEKATEKSLKEIKQATEKNVFKDFLEDLKMIHQKIEKGHSKSILMDSKKVVSKEKSSHNK